MDAASERRRADLARLNRLCAVSGGRLRVVASEGNPPTRVTVEIDCRTAASSSYPAESTRATRARIVLPAAYPLLQPQVYLTPPTFHPNVFGSGLVCLGATWLPTEGLDLLVKRLVRIITFDPAIVNTSSPANQTASYWYQLAVKRSPASFPTDSFSFGAEERPRVKPVWRDMSRTHAAADTPAAAAEPRKPSWRNLATGQPAAGRRTVRCDQCTQALRVPDVAGTQVRCPTCRHTFRVAS